MKLGSTTLKLNTDYKLSYTNNTNAGTATLTVTGIGNYTGTKKATFTINKAAQKITAKASAASVAVGKTVTISMLVSEVSSSFKGIRFSLDSSNSVGTNSTTLGNTDMAAATAPGLYTATFTVPATISHSGINAALYQGGTGRAAGDYCVISAVKVELGDTQTLAHQENSVWVLNEIPNFEEQLARCQRFAYEFNLLGSQYVYIGTGAANSTTSMQCPISLPVTMRAKPTVTSSGTFSVGGQNVTAFTLARFGGAQGTLVSTVASGLTTGAAYSLQTTADTDSLLLSADL